MQDLPVELWHQIASFLMSNSDSNLHNLLGINRVFFNIVLDSRWKIVRFSTGSISPRTLERLLDPFVANRVQELIVLLYLDQENFKTRLKPIKTLYQQLRPAIVDSMPVRFRRSPKRTSKPEPRREQSATFIDVVEALLAISPHLSSICNLEIKSTWQLAPRLSHPVLRPLLPSFSTSFGAHLRRLHLEGNVQEYRVLLGSNPSFSCLRVLLLEFKQNHTLVGHGTETHVLVGVIAPFLNSVRPHLESLTIKSHFSLDFTGFFTQLSSFPMLNSLHIGTAFSRTRHYPSSLINFLADNSSTLQTLALPIVPFQRFSPELEYHEPLSQWLLNSITDKRCFIQLRVLDVYPTMTAASLEIILAFIQRSSKTLAKLTVRGRFFQLGEAKAIVTALSDCNHLTELYLNIWGLDIGLLDDLSNKTPGLVHIRLRLAESLFENNELGLTLLEGLAKRNYSNWGLKQLAIKYRGGRPLEHDFALALANSFPSLSE